MDTLHPISNLSNQNLFLEKIKKMPASNLRRARKSELNRSEKEFSMSQYDRIWASKIFSYIDRNDFFDITPYLIDLRLGNPEQQREALKTLRILYYNLRELIYDFNNYIDKLEKTGVSDEIISDVADFSDPLFVFRLKSVVFNEISGKLKKTKNLPRQWGKNSNKFNTVKNNPKKLPNSGSYYTEKIYNYNSTQFMKFIFNVLASYFRLEPTEQVYQVQNNPNISTLNTFTMTSNPLVLKNHLKTRKNKSKMNINNMNVNAKHSRVRKEFVPLQSN